MSRWCFISLRVWYQPDQPHLTPKPFETAINTFCHPNYLPPMDVCPAVPYMSLPPVCYQFSVCLGQNRFSCSIFVEFEPSFMLAFHWVVDIICCLMSTLASELMSADLFASWFRTDSILFLDYFGSLVTYLAR